MKTFFISIVLLLSALYSGAQTIPNSDFENWNTVNLFKDPQGFFTSNLQAFIMGKVPPVGRSSDKHSGSYAAMLTTEISGNDTILGIITNAQFSNGNFGGGIPFTQRFDTLHFFTKYGISGGDSAAVLIMAKYSGNSIGMAFKRFAGSTSSYTEMKIPMNWFVPAPAAPDSIIFIMISSDHDIHPVDGSWVLVDDIKLDNTPMPGGDFESWIMHSYEDPVNWQSMNFVSALFPPPYVTKTTDAYSGSFAMKISTKFFNNNHDTLAHVTNGRILSGDFAGGMHVLNNPKRVRGYYKYVPVGFDTALVALRAYGFDSQGQYKNLTNNIIKLPAASSFSPFSIDLYYTAWPPIDTLGIAFASSNIYDGFQWVKEGSMLIVDSLTIEYFPVGIAAAEKSPELKVYPNPAGNIINFNTGKVLPSEIRVYDNTGKEVIHKSMSGKSLDVKNLPAGIYFYDLISGGKHHKGKFGIRH